MPWRIMDEGPGLYIVLEGNVTFEEIRAANERGWEHPNLAHHSYQIWDHTAVERFELTPDQVQALARMDSVAFRTNRRLRTAFIAGRPEITSALESYLANIDKDVTEARIFLDVAAARAWIAEEP